MYSYGVPNGPVIKHTLRCFWQGMGENGELLFPVAFTMAQIQAHAHTHKANCHCTVRQCSFSFPHWILKMSKYLLK